MGSDDAAFDELIEVFARNTRGAQLLADPDTGIPR